MMHAGANHRLSSPSIHSAGQRLVDVHTFRSPPIKRNLKFSFLNLSALSTRCRCSRERFPDPRLHAVAQDPGRPLAVDETSISYQLDENNRSNVFEETMKLRWIKLTLLSSYLTLQGSQVAFAGNELSNMMQSIPYVGDVGDISSGFTSAFLLIFFSELGDKTFFIAALLAARNSSAIIFTGTFGALAVMTIISVVIGRTFHYVDDILPFRLGETDLPIDDIAAVLLLVYYGVSTLKGATSEDDANADEQKEAELAISKFSGHGAGSLAAASTVISTFVLVFVAEWGDKSFFSTVALAAASSPLGVIAGSLAGHGVATLIAVLGGSLLSTFLSEKAISYVGGVLFLLFAAITLVEIAT